MDKIDNLVLFPSSKHYRPNLTVEQQLLDESLQANLDATLAASEAELEHGIDIKQSLQNDPSDPLESLLAEGQDIVDLDLEEEESDLTQVHIEAMIAQYQNMIKSAALLSGSMAQARRLQILSAIQQRISYYMGELERYLPGRGMH